MQTEVSATTTQSATGFHQMADGLKRAMKDFETMKSSQGFAGFMALFAPLGGFAIHSWKSTASFARRRPLETSVIACAAGLVIAYMLMPTKKV